MLRACLLLFTVAACEHGVNIQGNVVVSPDVQGLYSPSSPGVVAIATDIPGTGLMAAELGVLCQPSSQALVIPFELDDFGCAHEAQIDAWVVEASPGATCGITQVAGFDGFPGVVDASASTTIFRGRVGGGCRNGEVVLDLIID
jgi:hypothetical protein